MKKKEIDVGGLVKLALAGFALYFAAKRFRREWKTYFGRSADA